MKRTFHPASGTPLPSDGRGAGGEGRILPAGDCQTCHWPLGEHDARYCDECHRECCVRCTVADDDGRTRCRACAELRWSQQQELLAGELAIDRVLPLIPDPWPLTPGEVCDGCLTPGGCGCGTAALGCDEGVEG